MTNLEYLLMQAQYTLNETYETALQDCFNYYVEKEIDDGDDLIEAKKDFEKSEYYFLTEEQFEKNKIDLINSIKKDADRDLINSIDTLTIEELRKEKLIYNQILKIVDQIADSHYSQFDNDCKLVF